MGWDKLPLIANYDQAAPAQNSYTASTSHPLVQLGLLAKLFNTSLVNVELTPFVTYGFDFLNSESGNHLSYGLGGNVLVGLGKTSPLKLVATGNYTGRAGTWSTGLKNADYNYSLFRYGGGLRYVGDNFWIQPGVYWDNPNSRITGTSPSFVAAIDAEIASKWRISLSYGADYLNQGTLRYPLAFRDGKQDYR